MTPANPPTCHQRDEHCVLRLPLLTLTLVLGAFPCQGEIGPIVGKSASTAGAAPGAESLGESRRMAMNPPAAQPRHTKPDQAQIRSLVGKTARRHGVEPALIEAVISAESAYDARAVSHAGAVGLMQIMPATAKDYGIRDSADLFDPALNIDTGVRHLKRLLRKYGNDYGRVIMAYNAGEGAVDNTNSNVRYTETLDYMEAVVRHYRRLGGVKSTDHVLTKVRMLRRPGKRRSSARRTKSAQGHSMLLPVVSPRLQGGIPTASAPASPSDGNPATPRQERFVSEVRSIAVDPTIRHASRPAGHQGLR